MNWISYIVFTAIAVTFACLFLKASYVEASINARKLGTLLLLITIGGAGYHILREPAELYTVPLVLFGACLSSGTWMYVFDWFMAKRARNSDCAS